MRRDLTSLPPRGLRGPASRAVDSAAAPFDKLGAWGSVGISPLSCWSSDDGFEPPRLSEPRRWSAARSGA